MSYQTTSNNRSNLLVNYRPGQTYKPEHYTQTRSIDRFDHSTNTDEEFLEGTFNSRQRNSNYFLTPTKYRTITRPPLSNIFSSTNNYHRQQKSQDNRDDDDDSESLGYGEKIIIPTKYRLQQERMKRLMNGENLERSRSPPTTTYHRRQPSSQSARTKSHEDNRQVHRDSSPENVENNYYELQSTSQQQSRTQSQIYERRQIPNSSSPVVQQVNQSNYSQRHENYRRNGLKRDSSPLQEQHVPSPSTNRSRKDSSPVRDQIDYYEVDAQSTQSSPTKQSQPRSQRSTSPEQITPIRQRDPSESNQTSHYYELDHSQKRPNSETKISPSQRLDQSPSKPVNNQFKVVAADFELRASPPDENPDSNQSQPPKMELIFKATLQGSDVEKRAQYSISELVTQRSRSQSNTSNLIEPKKTSLANSPDREQINSTDMIPSTYEQDYQTDSNYQSGSYMGQSPLKQTQTDQTQLLITPKHTSNQQITSLDNPIELPLASRQSSTHRPRVENDSTFDGIRERTPSVPRNYIPLVYEKNPFRQTDNSLTSPKLFSPSKSEQRAQYNFGKRAPSHQSDEEEERREDEEEEDDDDDGFQCETFGHSSQIRPVTNTSAKRNLDFPSTTAPQFSPEKSSNSPKQQIEPSSDTSTFATSSLVQQLKQHFANQGSTENLQQQSQTPLPPRSDDVVQDSYVASPNYTTVTENPSNTTANNLQQQGDSYYYEENQEHEESPQRTEKNKADEQSSQYDDDDNHHNDDSVTDDNEEETNDDDDDQEEEKNDQDVHDQNQIDHSYTNDVNQYDDSQQSSGNRESGIGVLVQQDPTRDPTSSVAPTQYPPVPKTTTTTTTTVSKTKQKPPKEKKGGFFSFFRGKKKLKQKAQT